MASLQLSPEAATEDPPNMQAMTSPDNSRHAAHFKQCGFASWYGKVFNGRRTASGERYDMRALTAAHRTLPLGSWVRVTALGNARSIIVRINDRGPYTRGRVIDLSYAAAVALGLQHAGSTRVEIDGVEQRGSQYLAVD
jgi:rare lipoprotein A